MNKSQNVFLQLQRLQRRMQKEDLPLKKSATQLVFSAGDPLSGVMIIGEAPGRKEDEQGEPFVGAAGKQLEKWLAFVGLTRQDVYITNIVKYRPPDNRNPSQAEIAQHTPFLLEQIEIMNPRRILTLGNFSSRFLLNEGKCQGMNGIAGISQLHGQSHNVSLRGRVRVVIPLYHPAAVLYNRQLMAVAETDFRRACKGM